VAFFFTVYKQARITPSDVTAHVDDFPLSPAIVLLDSGRPEGHAEDAEVPQGSVEQP
jgi:hypothetical protein